MQSYNNCIPNTYQVYYTLAIVMIKKRIHLPNYTFFFLDNTKFLRDNFNMSLNINE